MWNEAHGRSHIMLPPDWIIMLLYYDSYYGSVLPSGVRQVAWGITTRVEPRKGCLVGRREAMLISGITAKYHNFALTSWGAFSVKRLAWSAS